MAKRNEDETENIVSDMELNVHCSNKDVSVPYSSTSSLDESEKILVDDEKNTLVISKGSTSNQTEVIVKPLHTKNVKNIRVKSTPEYDTLFPDFYFSSANGG